MRVVRVVHDDDDCCADDTRRFSPFVTVLLSSVLLDKRRLFVRGFDSGKSDVDVVVRRRF